MMDLYPTILLIFCYSMADVFTYFMRKLIDKKFK